MRPGPRQKLSKTGSKDFPGNKVVFSLKKKGKRRGGEGRKGLRGPGINGEGRNRSESREQRTSRRKGREESCRGGERWGGGIH